MTVQSLGMKLKKWIFRHNDRLVNCSADNYYGVERKLLKANLPGESNCQNTPSQIIRTRIIRNKMEHRSKRNLTTSIFILTFLLFSGTVPSAKIGILLAVDSASSKASAGKISSDKISVVKASPDRSSSDRSSSSKTSADKASSDKTSSSKASATETSSTGLADTLDHPELQAGLEAWMTGDPQNCERLIRMACEKEPNLSPPPIIMALLYSNAGKYPQMREYLENAIDEYPEDPEPYLQLAGIAFRENRLIETKLLLEKGTSLFEKYEEKSKKEKINNNERLDYLRHEYLTLKASFANKKKNAPEAERLIRLLLASEPKNDETLASLGYLLFLQDKFTESEKILNQAHEINKNRLPGWLALAHLLENGNKTEEAQKLIDSKFTPESTRYDLVPSVVRLLMKWDRMKDAEQYIVKLQKDAGNLASTWIISGEYALYKHQYYPAEEAFQRAVLMEPGNAEANNGLALALADQSNKTKMKTALETARRNWNLNPDSTDYKITYAWILFLAGNKDEANTFFAPMLESGKVTQTAAYYLAEIANLRGDQSLALNLLDIALGPKTNFPKREAAEELRKMIDKKKD